MSGRPIEGPVQLAAECRSARRRPGTRENLRSRRRSEQTGDLILGAVPLLRIGGGDATFQTLETHQITAYISLGREGKPDAPPNPVHEATQRMAARLASEIGRARSRRPKTIVEPVIGWIKEVLGFRRVSLRGEAKARGVWTVVCLAVNLKRLHRIGIA